MPWPPKQRTRRSSESLKKRAIYNRDWKRKRYQEDAEYRQCVLDKQAAYYAENPEPRKAYNKKRNALLQEQRMELLRTARAAGCVDCGWNEVLEILEFDHVRGEKLFCPGGAGGRSVEATKEEIAKCDVRCPTCHRLRHLREAQNALA